MRTGVLGEGVGQAVIAALPCVTAAGATSMCRASRSGYGSKRKERSQVVLAPFYLLRRRPGNADFLDHGLNIRRWLGG